MRKIIATFLIGLSVLAIGCVTSRPSKKPPARVHGLTGRPIAQSGISIDADDDVRLNNLIPGYLLLPVVVKNISLSPIEMDAKTDRWVIVGEKGKKYHAINSMREKDPVRWRELPVKLRNLIDYPEIIPINYTVTFDLLFPVQTKLKYFREIRYYNAAMRQEFVLEKQY